MRQLRAEHWVRRRRLGTALGVLSIALVKTPACFAAPVPANPGHANPDHATPGQAQPAAADCAKGSAGAPPQGKAEASGSSRQIVSLVIGGVGVAAITTGIVYELKAHSSNQKADELCRWGSDGGSCMDAYEQARHQQLVSDGQRYRKIGFVALGVGGAALVTATVLLLTGSEQAHPDDTPELGLSVGDGNWGATLSGRF